MRCVVDRITRVGRSEVGNRIVGLRGEEVLICGRQKPISFCVDDRLEHVFEYSEQTCASKPNPLTLGRIFGESQGGAEALPGRPSVQNTVIIVSSAAKNHQRSLTTRCRDLLTPEAFVHAQPLVA